MAGPWFTVQDSEGDEWHTLDRVWLSDGRSDGPAKVQIRFALEPADETKLATAR